jgi:DNA invertase Pin-like site-specific DNA recombinase
LLDLLAAAQAREFDAVLTESIDRLSRDLEDIAGLHKRLAYWGVKIVTLADGEVGKLHVGLKGIIASIYPILFVTARLVGRWRDPAAGLTATGSGTF